MNQDERTKYGNFRKQTRFETIDGKKKTLDSLILNYRRAKFIPACEPEETNVSDIIEQCHPFLIIRYIVDWKRLPDGYVPRGQHNGLQFGKYVIKMWEEFCWKNHTWNSDELKCYKSIDNLREAITSICGTDNLFWEGHDYFDLECELVKYREQQLAQEEEIKRREAEKQEAERQRLLAENKAKEAKRIAEEQARQAAYDEAQRNADIHRNPMWSRSAAPTKPATTQAPDASASRISKPQTPTSMKSPFRETAEFAQALDPFQDSDISMLLSPIPHPAANQIVFSRNGNSLYLEQGSIVAKGQLSARKFQNKLYICVDKTVRESETVHGHLIQSMLNFYSAERYVCFTLSENESQNNNLDAYRITDTQSE